MKVLIIHGPNLNLLGTREPSIYGYKTLDNINEMLISKTRELNLEVDFFQSNHEGLIIDKLHDAINKYRGIIINAAAFTHYSYALRDAIRAINIPTVEVHLSNVHQREEFRTKSVIAPVCIGSISGFGEQSYLLALQYFANKVQGD